MNYIIGSDEVGYGASSGNLVVCGIKAQQNWTMPGLKDSKKFKKTTKLTAHQQRQYIAIEIQKRIDNKEISFYLAERTNYQIDAIGVGLALKDCFVEIFKALYCHGDRIITDGTLNFKSYNLPFQVESIVKADDKFTTVMAASIMAKVYRDNKMIKLHQQYPQYNWNTNFGYLSPDHIAALKQYGLCNLHRKSYKIKALNK